VSTRQPVVTFLPAPRQSAVQNRATPSSVRREDVLHLMEGGAQLLDVRDPHEFEDSHLPRAANVPLARLSAEAIRALDASRPVIVYSRDGQCDLSARAAWCLAALGFAKVFRYTAGTADWLANGLPVEGKRSQTISAASVARRHVPICLASELAGATWERFDGRQAGVCVVVNEQLIVMGLLEESQARRAPEARAEELMDSAPRTCRCDAAPTDILAGMRRDELRHVLVTTSGGQLVGLLDRSALEMAVETASSCLVPTQ
jgi:rhodanese-related sulfurtransferase